MSFSSFDFDVITGPAIPRGPTESPADRNKAPQTDGRQTDGRQANGQQIGRSGSQPEGSRKS